MAHLQQEDVEELLEESGAEALTPRSRRLLAVEAAHRAAPRKTSSELRSPVSSATESIALRSSSRSSIAPKSSSRSKDIARKLSVITREEETRMPLWPERAPTLSRGWEPDMSSWEDLNASEVSSTLDTDNPPSIVALMHCLSGTPQAAPIQGNLYRYWGFGLGGGGRLLELGMAGINLVQVLMPSAILWWACSQCYTNGHMSVGREQQEPDVLVRLCREVVAVVAIVAFTANGYAAILADAEAWVKVKTMLRALESRVDESTISWIWLHMGPIVSSYVLLMCCVDLTVLMLVADGPKDAVLHALAILFVYNLDELGNSFLSDDDWNATNLGAYYARLKERFTVEEPELFNEAKNRNLCYGLTRLILTLFFFLLPALFLAVDLDFDLELLQLSGPDSPGILSLV